MSFRITGLPADRFGALYGLDDAALAARGVVRMRVTHAPGFPDRVTLADAAPGSTVLLLNYEHQPAATPFRASHAIYVLEGADRTYDEVDKVPLALACRPLSVRAFDARHWIREARIVPGEHLGSAIGALLADPAAAYLHVHYAAFGCYAARVERV